MWQMQIQLTPDAETPVKYEHEIEYIISVFMILKDLENNGMNSLAS